MSKEIAWFQAAEIIGISPRQMQRWKNRWEKHRYEGLLDRRRGGSKIGSLPSTEFDFTI